MPRKLVLNVDDKDLWNRVLKFKIDEGLKNNNETVVKLIQLGLSKKEKPSK